MKFKVGDRVRVTSAESCKKYRGKIGIITFTDRIKRGLSCRWDYEVTFDNREILPYPVSSEEVEIYIRKNQQLLFDFWKR